VSDLDDGGGGRGDRLRGRGEECPVADEPSYDTPVWILRTFFKKKWKDEESSNTRALAKEEPVVLLEVPVS
jgi:hypothetical protein